MGETMTKPEWLNILAWYKAINQIEQLPDADYTAAMYDKLSDYDGRFIAYAVEQFVAHETSYNRYPLLSDINRYLPNFSAVRREIDEKAQRLKRLLGEKLRPTHWYYKHQKAEINALVYFFTGQDGESIDAAQLERATDQKYRQYLDRFFGQTKTKLITTQRTHHDQLQSDKRDCSCGR